MKSTGEIIIEAVIRAAALQTAVPVEEGFVFVWSANAAEQIEAALHEAGYTLSPTQQKLDSTS